MPGGVPTELEAVEIHEVLDVLREGLQILSPTWRYLYVNDAVARHGRKRRDELLGRTMLECYPGIEHTPVFATLARCMRERREETVENEFEYEDGRRAWFELRIRPYRDGLIVLSLEITERKQLEASLRQAYKLQALGEMASGVAHDLTNLLNPVTGQLELLARGLDVDSEARDRVAHVLAILDRGKETIARLRDYARPAPLTPAAPLAVDPIVREAAALCRSRVGAGAGFVVIEDALGAPPPARVSGPELLSAMVNLIVNALDAVPDGGKVVLRSGTIAAGILIAVDDNGVGMPPEVQARAFEPFFTTKGEHGTGLGLAMVHAFAVRHGGAVQIRSTPGAGTSVTLTLPTG